MFLSLVQKRRSIRRYLEKPVEKEKIDSLMEAALRSPSSKGISHWEFIVVTDKELLKKLSAAKPHGASFLKNAPMGVIVCADPSKCDVWVEDASIASIFLHLASTSMGLGSCWIQIRKRMYDQTKTSQEYIRKLLKIPENLNVESIVAIGYPAESKPPHKKESLAFDQIYFDFFGQRK